MKATRAAVYTVLFSLGTGSIGACQSAPLRHGLSANGHQAADQVEQAKTGSDAPLEAKAVNLRQLPDLAAVIPSLARNRVVFVGETHDRYADHLLQLEIIRRLHARHPNLAIGLEYFQQPFQKALDAYVAGEISESQMLEKTEYFDRWRFDYRLYRPILAYAREHNVRLLALNVPAEITRKVAQQGIEALTPEERVQIPETIDRSDEAYRKRLRTTYEMHPEPDKGNFDRFVDAQLVWDEGMAECAADFLKQHPETHLVVLAGSGHLMYGSGIPNRLRRRLPAPMAIVLNAVPGELDAELADYLLIAGERSLPPAGRLGAYLDVAPGTVTIERLEAESAAQKAGLKTGDRILAIDERRIDSMADIRIALLDKNPRDEITVQVRRDGWLTEADTLSFVVRLQ